MPSHLESNGGVTLARRASVALRRIGALQEAYDVSVAALRVIIKQHSPRNLCTQLLNIASTVGDQNYLAFENRLLCLANDAALILGDENDLVSYWLARFRQLSKLGKWHEALTVWEYCSDDNLSPDTLAIAAHHYAVHLYQRGELTDDAPVKAEKLSRFTKSALGIRNLCSLRGFWFLEQDKFDLAKKSLQGAVALAHKANKIDRRSEICLAIAKHNLNELSDPSHIASQFEYGLDESCQHALANLWFAIGDYERARSHALAAYKWAWADGEPYTRFSELSKIRALLAKLDAEPPKLPKYDLMKDEKHLWEDEVAVIIGRYKT